MCSLHLIKPVICVGMELENSIGKNGTFYYPKLDLIATVMLLKDVPELSKADAEDKEAIFKIRENFNVARDEELRRKKIAIHYETKIPGLENWDLEQTIKNTRKTFLKAKIDEKDLDFF